MEADVENIQDQIQRRRASTPGILLKFLAYYVISSKPESAEIQIWDGRTVTVEPATEADDRNEDLILVDYAIPEVKNPAALHEGMNRLLAGKWLLVRVGSGSECVIRHKCRITPPGPKMI